MPRLNLSLLAKTYFSHKVAAAKITPAGTFISPTGKSTSLLTPPKTMTPTMAKSTKTTIPSLSIPKAAAEESVQSSRTRIPALAGGAIGAYIGNQTSSALVKRLNARGLGAHALALGGIVSGLVSGNLLGGSLVKTSEGLQPIPPPGPSSYTPEEMTAELEKQKQSESPLAFRNLAPAVGGALGWYGGQEAASHFGKKLKLKGLGGHALTAGGVVAGMLGGSLLGHALMPKTSSINGLCLSVALDAIEKDPRQQLMMGPPGRIGDTAHFWTMVDGEAIERTPYAVPSNYVYAGRPIAIDSLLNELDGVGELDESDEPFPKMSQVKHPNRKLEDKYRSHGLPISIETAKGSKRSGTDADGKDWSITMTVDYGYIRGTESWDGEHLDCFIGPEENAPNVYVVRQIDPKTKKFDEDKVLIGFKTKWQAWQAYKSNYNRLDHVKGIREIPLDAFKAMLKVHRGHHLTLSKKYLEKISFDATGTHTKALLDKLSAAAIPTVQMPTPNKPSVPRMPKLKMAAKPSNVSVKPGSLGLPGLTGKPPKGPSMPPMGG